MHQTQIVFDKIGYDILRDVSRYSGDNNIEFELRFGKIDSGKKFNPSLFPQETINRIRNYVEKTLRLQPHSTQTTVHIMNNNIRQVIDDKGSYFERKTKLSQHDINYNDFTLRMSLAKEDRIAPPIDRTVIETRIRKRDEFYYPHFYPRNSRKLYTYVFTTITRKRGDEVETFYEFEIEVVINSVQNEQNVGYVLNNILYFICEDCEDKVTRYLPINTQTAIRADCLKYESKPKNLERSDIITIRTNEYTVTNKLDGERFVLLFNGNGLYAVNKRLVDHIIDTRFGDPILSTTNFSSYTDRIRPVAMLDTELFDGCFHVFDCMIYNGKDITMQNHTYRRECATKVSSILPKYTIMKKFREVTTHDSKDSQSTLDLLTFLHRDSEYECNDGIVYTPNDIYRSGDIYKWKFPEKMSIDFKLKLKQSAPYTYELQLYDKGDVFYVFNGSTQFPLSHDEATFISDEPLIDGGIYEFKYENEKFALMRERPDKVKPNFRTTGESVWNDIKNPFTEKELIKLLNMPLEALPIKEPSTNVLPILPILPPSKSKEGRRKDPFKTYKDYHGKIKDKLIQGYCKKNVILDLGSGKGGDLWKYGQADIEYLWAVEPFQTNYDEFKKRVNNQELNDRYNIKDKTTLIETGAQSTKKITDTMGQEKADVITSFFSLSFFFFKDTTDLQKLVRTIAAALKVGGTFIGTTIDGERTKALLSRQSPFNFDGGHLKRLDDGNVEVFMDGIVGTQTESLVNFPLLCGELQKYDIILESTEFFVENLALTESLRVLNSLYRTFVFRRHPPSNLDNIIRSHSDDGQLLIDIVLKRLTMSEYSHCFEEFKKLLRSPQDPKPNESFTLSIRFPSNEDDKKYCGKHVKDMQEFTNGYIYINPFIAYHDSLNFAKTYGCIQTEKEYLLITSSCQLLSKSKYVDKDSIMISILLQLYYSLLMLSHENGYFREITSSNIAFHKRTDIKQIIYDGVAVDVINGIVLVFNGYENYAQTDKPYDISLPTIFEGMKISKTFASLIEIIPSTINNESINTLRDIIKEFYNSKTLQPLMPSLYATHTDMISHLYKNRKDQLISYISHLYKNFNKRFKIDKVEKMMSGNDGEILTFLRKELRYQRDEETKHLFVKNRDEKSARDIKQLFKEASITDHITSYMDFGCADGSMTSILSKEFEIPEGKTFCVDLENWGNMHRDKTRDRYKDITVIPTTQGDRHIPLLKESVMFITSLQVLHHMPDPQHTIDEFYRVLTPGGVIFLREHDSTEEDDNKMFDLIHILNEIVLTEDKPNWSYRDGPQPVYRSAKVWREMFEKAGFKSVISTKASKEDSNLVFDEVFIKESSQSLPVGYNLDDYDLGDDEEEEEDEDEDDEEEDDEEEEDEEEEDEEEEDEEEEDEDEDEEDEEEEDDYLDQNSQQFNTSYPISTRFRNTDRFMRGIENLRNTCYLNAAVQSIVTALPIMQFFCNKNRKEVMQKVIDRNKGTTRTQGKLVNAFSDLVCNLTTVDTDEPIQKSQIRYIKSIVGKLNNKFKGGEQQDSSEFIVTILNGLHDELAVEGDSFINQLFGGSYTTKMECVECGYKKIRTDIGHSIELPLQDAKKINAKTIDDALANYSADEEMTEANAVLCENCTERLGVDTKRIFNKKIVMSHAPEILVTSFKRFGFKMTVNRKGKKEYVYDRINNRLSFPEDLVIKEEHENDEGTSNISYSLYAIINHMGHAGGGHYTANIKNGDDWYTCDDEDVYRVKNISKLLKDNKDAYVLFYHRVR